MTPIIEEGKLEFFFLNFQGGSPEAEPSTIFTRGKHSTKSMEIHSPL